MKCEFWVLILCLSVVNGQMQCIAKDSRLICGIAKETEFSILTNETWGDIGYTTDMILSGCRIIMVIPHAIHGVVGVLRVYMNDNYLKELHQDVFQNLLQVQEIYLQKNTLVTIHPNAFEKLTKLKMLNLDNNFLLAADTAMPWSYGTKVLSVFSIKNNSPDFSIMKGENFPEDLKRYNYFFNRRYNSLRSLNLMIESITVLSLLASDNMLHQEMSIPIFEKEGLLAIELSRCNISAWMSYGSFYNSIAKRFVYDSNSVTKIDNDFFRTANKLEYISLRDNMISQLPNRTFNHIKNLRTILLSGNRFMSLPKDTFVDNARLRTVHLDRNSIQHLDGAFFEKNNKLLDLNLSTNSLKEISSDCFKNLRGLESLDLSDNLLSNVDAVMIMHNRLLKTLRLGSNHLTTIPRDFFAGHGSLEILDLSRNRITTFEVDVFNNVANLQDLDLSYNGIESLLPRSFFANRAMVRLDLSGNAISKLDVFAFSSMSELQKLDLSDNQLLSLPDMIFMNNARLEYVDLSGNRLKRLHNDMLDAATNLSTLLLERNLIEEFTFKITKKTVGLKILNLAHNRLKMLTAESFNLKHLEVLVVSANTISYMPKEFFSAVVGTQTRLFLDRNPLRCSCLEHLISGNVPVNYEIKSFSDGKSVTCVFDKDRPCDDSDLDGYSHIDWTKSLEESCYSYSQ